ncbi:MAG: glycosyltransferase [Nanoarchaeota archaeon]
MFPDENEPAVSIIILNWNGREETKKCLDSLKKIQYHNYNVILVDNGSKDGSAEYFERHYPHVELIKHKENLGFTGGVNRGILVALKKKETEYIFLLNNDCIVDPLFLKELVVVGEEATENGIIGPKLYYYSLPHLIWSAGGTYIPWLGKPRVRGINKEDTPEFNKKCKVDWMTGCTLIKKSVFDKIGLFDEDYFSNYEDVDFSFRARNAGFSIYYVPTSLIYHKVAKDWGGVDNPLYIYYQTRNNLLFIKKNIQFPTCILSYFTFFTISFPKRLIPFTLSGESKKVKAIFFGVTDFLKGRYHKTERDLFHRQKSKKRLRIGINFTQESKSTNFPHVFTKIRENENNVYDYVSYYYKTKEGSQDESTIQKKDNIIDKPLLVNFSLRILWEIFIAALFFKNQQLDLLHSDSYILPLFKPRLSVITINTKLDDNIPYWRRLVLSYTLHATLKNADMVITDSKEIRKWLVSSLGTNLRKVFVLEKGKEAEQIMHLYDRLLDRDQEQAYTENTLPQNIQYSNLTIGINARYLQRSLSGIERYSIELISSLNTINTKNDYLLFLNKDAPLPKLPQNDHCKSIISAFPTKQRFLRLLWEHVYLFYEIKKYNVSVFHGPAFFVPILKPKNCKYVITVHDITFVKYPQAFTLGTRLYYTLLFPRSLHLADAIITDSESTKKDIIQEYKINSDKIHTIYLGVSDGFLKKYTNQKVEEIKKKYRLSDKFFLFTGVLSPRKNIHTTLEAFHYLKKEEEYKDYKFLIIGRKGWLYRDIFTKVAQLHLEDAVSFIEYVSEEELPLFYTLAEIYLFPSLYEGFGLPILEAMASGCPVITSNVSSMPEVASDAALLINPTSVEELIAAIKQITTNKQLRANLQKKGYEQVKKFSWKKTAEQTAAIYELVLKQKGE